MLQFVEGNKRNALSLGQYIQHTNFTIAASRD
jgi:hypothetical protein